MNDVERFLGLLWRSRLCFELVRTGTYAGSVVVGEDEDGVACRFVFDERGKLVDIVVIRG